MPSPDHLTHRPLTADTSEGRARLFDLYRLNRARFQSAGWRLNTVLALPALALRTVFFPAERPEWAPEAPMLPLLPSQRAIAERFDQPARVSGPAPRYYPMPRLRRTGPSELRMRDGILVEPLRHHAHGNRKHFAPRVRQEVDATVKESLSLGLRPGRAQEVTA